MTAPIISRAPQKNYTCGTSLLAYMQYSGKATIGCLRDDSRMENQADIVGCW